MDKNCQKHRVHIAIVDMSTIRLIAQGAKTIESRFSKNRIKPYDMVFENDLVLLKNSGGGIFGYFYVDRVESLTDFKILDVKEKYNDRIAADNSFWSRKANARFASLIYCKNPVMVESGVNFKRTGMDGWIILPQNHERHVVCFSGPICSGKTGYARCLAELLDARYICLENVIQKYALDKGFGNDVTAMLCAEQYIIDTGGISGFVDLVIPELEGLSSRCHVVLDGVRHKEMYHEINCRLNGATLIYVDAKSQERYRRYLEDRQENMEYKEFLSMDDMLVDRGIPALKNEADYIIKSVQEKNLDTAVNITSTIISAMLTGQIYEKLPRD